MEPKKVIDKIINYIGKRGVVAGGAVRDITLGRAPKDYDIFIFYRDDFEGLVTKKGIFDEIPTKAVSAFASRYPVSFWVYNTTLSGLPIQIIWNSKYTEEGSPWWRIYSKTTTGEEVVGGFDFTINMMYVDYKKIYHITNKATTALKKKKIVFNKNHSSGFFEPMVSVDFLFHRMVYLANKLDFIIDSRAIANVYQKYQPYDEEMESLQLK